MSAEARVAIRVALRRFEPILFEQGDIGIQINRHCPWIPRDNVRYAYSWIKGAVGGASRQQVKKFTNAIVEESANIMSRKPRWAWTPLTST